ncbi:MAG: aminoglycoside phosphotransferase family protein [Patescibacteria group bacterium]|jgi:Ser/Thr protein kinase RdoA (MazF antagonist)
MENSKKPDEKMYTNIAQRLTTDNVILDSIIAEAVSWQPTSVDRLVLGVGNEVYKLVHPTEVVQNVILRIHHGDHKGFYFEKWAMEESRKHGVLVPKILKIGTVQAENKILTYCAEKELRGIPLSEILDNVISVTQMKTYAHLAGEALAKIHQVQTVGFGHFSENGIAPFKNLKDSIQQHDDYNNLIKVAHIAEVPEQVIEDAIKIVDNVSSEEKPHLIHVDYAPKHIFFDGETITGVIDFEICMSGIAATDLNRWRTQDNRLPMLDLIEGYKKVRELPADFWETMFAVQVHSALRTMLYHLNISKEKSEILRAVEELKNLLKTNKPLLH